MELTYESFLSLLSFTLLSRTFY